eukprot:TRINITY_DN4576_c0_g2_i1.p1 TRINITY_DN4576_c0_g2~~TRINITY_DN4576_c0_g2_i1.p1  ORF type:complete len:423 (+),score=84.43 TRINITY_DN4576_c0_g2_i1:47-1270(+)
MAVKKPLRIAEKKRLEEEERKRKEEEKARGARKRREKKREAEMRRSAERIGIKRQKVDPVEPVDEVVEETVVGKELSCGHANVRAEIVAAAGEAFSAILACYLKESANFITKNTPPSVWVPYDTFAEASPSFPSLKKQVAHLTKYTPTTLTSARVLFKWATLGRTKQSVGFARLFDSMLHLAGIESKLITGYAKGVGYATGALKSPNHTWNAIEVSGEWCYFDPCWAQGFGRIERDEVKNTAHFDDMWFNPPPEVFALSHYSTEAPPSKAVESLRTFISIPDTYPLRCYMRSLDGKKRSEFFKTLIVTARTGLEVPSPSYCTSPQICSILSAPAEITEGENYFKIQMHTKVNKVTVGEVPGKLKLRNVGAGVWEGVYVPAQGVDLSEIGVFYSAEPSIWHPILCYEC